MAHYFDYDDNLKKCEKEKIVKIKDTKIKLITDNGVFSKKGLDFGTRTLLECLEIEKIKGDVLDMGCGYGPIGIYVKLMTNASVVMTDINKRSIELASKNALLNGVDIETLISDAYENIDRKFDFIISNPPIRVGKKKLYEMLFEAHNYLKKEGELWIVVNKKQGAKSLIRDLSEKYKIVVKNKNKGFYVICAIRY